MEGNASQNAKELVMPEDKSHDILANFLDHHSTLGQILYWAITILECYIEAALV